MTDTQGKKVDTLPKENCSNLSEKRFMSKWNGIFSKTSGF